MSTTGIPSNFSRFAGLAAGTAAVLLAAAGVLLAQDIPITVQLTGPISSASARKGDPVSATVVSPDSLKGDTILGTVAQANNSRNQSSVTFTFNMLSHAGANVPIHATLQAVANSKGMASLDEGGQALQANNKTTNPGNRNGATSRIGGQLGGLVGGRTGQAVGDASSDVNTSGSSNTVMEISSRAQGLNLAPGASLTISAKSASGPSLESLAPNAASGAPVAAASAAPVASPAASPAATGAPPAGSAAASVSSGGQPELKATKIEFVPGERTVFFEDFSDMIPDEPPPHWKVRDGTVELRTGGGIRELYSEGGVKLTSESFVMPTNFTFEIDWTGGGEMVWHFRDKSDDDTLVVWVRGEESGTEANTSISINGEPLGSGHLATNTSQPVHFAMWAQQGRIRAYFNGERVVDVNQVKFAPADHFYVDYASYRPNGLRQVRMAESAPDFSAVINSTGKYVTHGIYFDTDSDRLKPESAAVLKQVAAALGRNPSLKLEIDGFTDSTGNADRNIELSKRRAQAVQSVLASQFGIEADRLSSNGFGASSPIASNDTPDGRANNRRVEFAKK